MPIEPVDKPERERVRHTLKRFKELHGIGDVLLAKLIARAINFDVGLSTLQRFLKGKHRTDDSVVDHYRRFLQMVAPPPAEDELGRALLKFFPARGESAPKRDLEGVYSTRTRPHVGLGIPMPEHLVPWRKANNPVMADCTAAWSTIHMRADSHPQILQVTEQVFHQIPGTPQLAEIPEELAWPMARWLGNKGFLVPIASAEYMMIVRSFFDARVYLLRRHSDDPLTLHGIVYQSSSVGPLRMSHGLPAFEIQMTRDASSAASGERPA